MNTTQIAGLTAAQHSILIDRARKHKALLHNQPTIYQDRSTGLWEEPEPDTRVQESEVILDQLLRRYGIIAGDEQIEEIAAVDATEAALNDLQPYLSVQTDRQTLEIPYN